MTSTLTPPSAPPAGWYADATGPGMHYWDGGQWSDPEPSASGILSRGSVRWAAAIASARTQPLWRQIWFIPAAVTITLVAVLTVVAGMTGGSAPTHHGGSAGGVVANNDRTAGATQTHQVRSTLTKSQRHASAAARHHLAAAAYSRAGLVQQLVFDGYTTADARFAANNLGADWYVQAAIAAKEYVSLSAFTRPRLISALRTEGFTPQQASYGADQTGF